MRLEDLQTFIKVTQHASLHRAAEALGLSQSALSKTLARMESEAGLQLFERSPRGLRLSSEGLALHEHAVRICLAVNDMQSDLGDRRHARVGRIRLGASTYLIPALLSPLLASYFVSRPLASFSIEVSQNPQLLESLRDGRIDLACASVPAEIPTGVRHNAIGTLALQAVTRSDHPRRDRLRSLSDLASERWILPDASFHLRHWVEEQFSAANVPPPSVAVESSASSVAFNELLRGSDLVGMLPLRSLGQAEGKGLAALEIEALSWRYELAVFWRDEGYLSPLCQDFRDALVQRCKDLVV